LGEVRILRTGVAQVGFVTPGAVADVFRLVVDVFEGGVSLDVTLVVGHGECSVESGLAE
jgi:hypothetical protein